MSIDMAQFHQVFFEESFEGLEVMETGLLNLDLGAADTEEINTIFRAAHSIKGGSGTFGFTEIADFTHVMETLLDEMRDGRREVTKESVDLLLESVDCLTEMLSATKAGDEIDSDRVRDTHQQLEHMLHEGSAAVDKTLQSSEDNENSSRPSGWRIKFRPHSHLFQTGNDPYRLLRELSEIGILETKVDVSHLPPFSEFDPEECYLAWELILTGELGREDLTEIFEWVEDDCDLKIIPLESDGAESLDQAEPSKGDDQSVPPSTSGGVEKTVSVTQSPATKAQKTKSRKQKGSKETGSIRVNIDKIDSLINMVGELVITQSMLSQLSASLGVDDDEQMRDGLEQLDRNTREIQESVMKIRMLPISFSFNRFPRLVHDLSSKLGKKVELKLSGEQTELDKTVLEKIGDPLVHLVRNSLDHGIESPDSRKAVGKSETGTVHLNAYHQGGNVVIEISDDGAGLNREKILSKAQERGIVSPDEQLSEEKIYDLLFQPGFSTAEQVSDVSGRGVGMDVVKRNIKDLGGTVEVTSLEGKGSTFTIRLPLTLAILDGQLVRVADETYIIPLVSIIESLQIKPENVSSVTGKVELYKLRDEYLPIIRLYETFKIEAQNTDLNDGLLVVVDGDGLRAGIFVDDLLGQQQVVIKSLESNYQKVKGVSGATILGDGTVALILDVSGVVEISSSAPRSDSNAADPHVKAVA
ncbi:MAG: chemotaxis protein CheA [Gammaproteobacteria bacterium]|nr:chemotaxis protein CheA [Gammaproteobacteria bacterium]